MKFLLKPLSYPSFLIFNHFVYVFNSLEKSFTILVSIDFSMSPYISTILCPNNHLFIHDVPYNSLIHFLLVLINPSFLDYPFNGLRLLPPELVDNIFCSFLSSNFPDFCTIYTNSLVSLKSTSFSVYFLSLKLLFTDCIAHFTFLFYTKGYAIIQTLRIIYSFPHPIYFWWF